MNEGVLRVLTVRQPWAGAIAHLGKDIENRPQWWAYRGPVLIHAGLAKRTPDDVDACADIALKLRAPDGHGYSHPYGLPDNYGQIIAITEIVDCIHESQVGHGYSPWFTGPYGYVLRNTQQLTPTLYTGGLGLRKVRYDDSLNELMWSVQQWGVKHGYDIRLTADQHMVWESTTDRSSA